MHCALPGFETETVRADDIILTPHDVARDVVERFAPTGKVLDPCKGDGAFLQFMPGAEWCEVREGRDFFGWRDPVDWIVSNPPYSTFKPWMLHSFTLAENVVYLVPLHKVFCGAKYLDAIMQYGGMPEVLVMGAGSRLGFPFGFVVGAIHFKRGYEGPTWIHRHNAPGHFRLEAQRRDVK